MQKADIGDQRHMQKSREQACEKAVSAGDGRKRGSEKRGSKRKGGMHFMDVENICEQNAEQNGDGVFKMFAVGRKADDCKNTAQNWPVYFAAQQQHITDGDDAHQPHIDKGERCAEIL